MRCCQIAITCLLVGSIGCGVAPAAGRRAPDGGRPADLDDGGIPRPPTDAGPRFDECELDVECDDRDPCTTDACAPAAGGEFTALACEHAPVADCGEDDRACALACDDGDPCTRDECRDRPRNGDIGEEECRHVRDFSCSVTPTEPTTDPGTAGDPVDPSCATGSTTEAVFLPYEPLEAVSLGACGNGIELQRCTGIVTARSTSPAGSAARTLVVDFATYVAPDRLRIEGTLASGETYVLLDTCRVSTWTRADPTDGLTRPPDETIRRFEIELRAGTVELRFDSSYATTPWYERVLGLCDFAVTPPTDGCARGFRTAAP